MPPAATRPTATPLAATRPAASRRSAGTVTLGRGSGSRVGRRRPDAPRAIGTGVRVGVAALRTHGSSRMTNCAAGIRSRTAIAPAMSAASEATTGALAASPSFPWTMTEAASLANAHSVDRAARLAPSAALAHPSRRRIEPTFSTSTADGPRPVELAQLGEELPDLAAVDPEALLEDGRVRPLSARIGVVARGAGTFWTGGGDSTGAESRGGRCRTWPASRASAASRARC